MCGVCVYWKSTSKTCVISLTAEAEHVASGDGVKEALFLYSGLESLQPHVRGNAIVVFEDNEGAKALSETPLARPAVSKLKCVIILSGVR